MRRQYSWIFCLDTYPPAPQSEIPKERTERNSRHVYFIIFTFFYLYGERNGISCSIHLLPLFSPKEIPEQRVIPMNTVYHAGKRRLSRKILEWCRSVIILINVIWNWIEYPRNGRKKKWKRLIKNVVRFKLTNVRSWKIIYLLCHYRASPAHLQFELN